jgi:hypothetical protein
MDEVKRKLSSLVELRKAIRELKIKIREQRAQKSSIPSQSQSEEKQPVAQPELIQEIESAPKDGNHGFIVKDGKLVVEDFVDINVVPADARAL